MATDLERLVVSLEANVKKFETELRRANKTTNDELDGIEKKFTQTGKGVGAATSNIAAQFQDIAVQLQGGQSPFTIALQQGTQISQVLGQRGAGGAVGLLSGAFTSLLSPISLATIGIIALGGAAVNYLTSAAGDVKTLDDLMAEHETTIKTLIASYGTFGKSIDLTPVKESTAVAEALVRENVRAMQKEYKSLSDTLVSSLTVYSQLGDAAGMYTEETVPKFKAFKDAIDAFRESAKNGAPDVRTLRSAIAEIERTTLDAKIKEQAAALLAMTAPLEKVDTGLRTTERTLGTLGQALAGTTEQWKNFSLALSDLSKMSLPKLDDRGKVMEAYNKALENATGIEERRAAAVGRDSALRRIASDEAKKAAEEAARDAERDADRAARRSAADQKAFADKIANVQKSTEMLKLEFDMIGATEQQRDKARTTLELENEAKKRNIDLTTEQRGKIEEVATAYAGAAERARQANVVMGEIRAVGSLVSDAFKSATLEGQKFDQVLSTLLNRLASRGIDSAFDALFKGLSSSAFGGGGRSLLGFASGGFTGPGGRNQPAGIVHKGEYVFDKAAVDRIGLRNLEMMRGYSSGGLVVAPGGETDCEMGFGEILT